MEIIQSAQFSAWLDGMRDNAGRSRILVRVMRLAAGNAGDHRNLTGGVSELRIPLGPGYRVYYSRVGNKVILLLAEGDKSTQVKDIKLALQLAKEMEDHHE